MWQPQHLKYIEGIHFKKQGGGTPLGCIHLKTFQVTLIRIVKVIKQYKEHTSIHIVPCQLNCAEEQALHLKFDQYNKHVKQKFKKKRFCY